MITFGVYHIPIKLHQFLIGSFLGFLHVKIHRETYQMTHKNAGKNNTDWLSYCDREICLKTITGAILMLNG